MKFIICEDLDEWNALCAKALNHLGLNGEIPYSEPVEEVREYFGLDDDVIALPVRCDLYDLFADKTLVDLDKTN